MADSTVADFSTGAPGTCAYIAQTTDGEVLLMPTVGAEFSGTALPTGWFSTLLKSNGSVVVANGAVTVTSATMGTNAYYTPGRSLEFVATFRASTGQHMGLGTTNLTAGSRAIFSTGTSGSPSLSARTYGSTTRTTNLGTSYLGAPHRYRIDWTSTQVVYYIDGVQVASHTSVITASMRPLASDQPGGYALTMDWMRMSPYATTCDFTSRAMDGGENRNWFSLAYAADMPVGTSLIFQTRTSTNGTTWSAWAAVDAGGSLGNPAGRYIQYKVTLASSNLSATPALQLVVVTGR